MVREKLVKCKVERSEDIFGRKVGFELMELIGDWIDTERFMEERSRWKTNGRCTIGEILGKKIEDRYR